MYAGDLVRDFRGLDSVRSVAYSRARKTSHGKVHYLCRCRSVVFLGILLWNNTADVMSTAWWYKQARKYL